ncbi:MAG: hypothetical protein Q8930_11160 [Bacillota bacterium]|nr:hypothetical protein [Bacillota bacterium]
MDFSSIVIMERDKETGLLHREIGSYKVEEGAEYITRAYSEEDNVYIFFSTDRDVEEWEYTAIYDLFPEDSFEEEGFETEFLDDEYNPTWRVKFKLEEEHSDMELKISKLCKLIKSGIEETMEEIKDKEDEYKEE